MRTKLPDYRPITWQIEAPDWFEIKEWSWGSVYPPLEKFDDETLIVDWYVREGKAMLTLWKKEDHPNLKLLPPDTPKIVKSVYKASYQLKILRATSDDGQFWTKFYDEWKRFQEKSA